MEFGLKGQKVALMVGGTVPEDDVQEPWDALVDSGAEVHLIAPRLGDVQVAGGSVAERRYLATKTLDQVKPEDYVALVVAGCVGEPHELAGDRRALEFIRSMMESDKPVAAIGAGVSVLAAADVLKGRTVTAPESLKAIVDRAGASWSDLAVQSDQKLLTARSCTESPAIGRKIAREFSNSLDSAKVDMLSLGSFPASDPPPGPVKAGH